MLILYGSLQDKILHIMMGQHHNLKMVLDHMNIKFTKVNLMYVGNIDIHLIAVFSFMFHLYLSCH
jgi:hypothetical protein